jgi:DNA polymerase
MTKAVKNRILYQLNFFKSIGYEYHNVIKLSNKEVNSNSLPNDISSLKNIVENCYLCDLSKSRKNVLFGEGNINASLIIISDEPTASEDELKSFYVGKTGEQLVKMIDNVLPIKKEDIYITNLVKCKSSNGINASHYSSCSTYLHKQIELINPKLVVTFGEKAYQYLCNDNSAFSQIRGQVMSFKNYQVIPTHSISFLLRNPSLKKESYSDMLKIKSILESN